MSKEPGRTAGNSNDPGIGLFSLVMMVTASMIGVGLYTSSGYALEALGNPSRVMAAWVVTGFWAIAGAVAYGAIASRVTISGGEYVYLSRLIHPSIGFLAGWISLISGFTVPIATSAKLVAEYGAPGGTGSVALNLVATIVILVAAALHAVKLQVGVASQNLVVILKLIVFGIIFVWAFGFSPSDAWQGGPLPNRSPALVPESLSAWWAFAASLIWISLSYTGFNAAIYVAGETKTAHRTVPQSMLLATLAVMAIYLACNFIFVYAPDSSQVTADVPSMQGIAASATRALGGVILENILRALVLMSVLSSVFSSLLAGPRVYSQMAIDGMMPRFFIPNTGVPRSAILVQALLSIIVVWISTLQSLIEYLSLTLSLCSSLAIASIWFIPFARRTEGDVQPKTVRWYEHLAAAAYILGTVVMIAAAIHIFLIKLLVAVATFVVGIVFYFVWTAWKQPRAVRV